MERRKGNELSIGLGAYLRGLKNVIRDVVRVSEGY